MNARFNGALCLAGLLTIIGWCTPNQQAASAQEEVEPQVLAPATELSPSAYGGAYVPGCRRAGVGIYACQPWQYGDPALFYNFYQGNNCGSNAAQMYLCPRPVPAMVGHTYYTYQPLMPHEFLYPHHRTYRKWYDDGRGMTRTHAIWYRGPISATLSALHNTFEIAR